MVLPQYFLYVFFFLDMYYHYTIFLVLYHGSSIAFFEVNTIVNEYHAIVIWLWYHLSAFLWKLNISWRIKHDFCMIFITICEINWPFKEGQKKFRFRSDLVFEFVLSL